jgi:hypothetical protein
VLTGPETVAFSWQTILGFLRLATTPKLFARPLELDEAIGAVGVWLSRDNVVIVDPTERHWTILSDLLPNHELGGL